MGSFNTEYQFKVLWLKRCGIKLVQLYPFAARIGYEVFFEVAYDYFFVLFHHINIPKKKHNILTNDGAIFLNKIAHYL